MGVFIYREFKIHIFFIILLEFLSMYSFLKKFIKEVINLFFIYYAVNPMVLYNNAPFNVIFLYKIFFFLVLLILIRCGTARYRYDYLSKIG